MAHEDSGLRLLIREGGRSYIFIVPKSPGYSVGDLRKLFCEATYALIFEEDDGQIIPYFQKENGQWTSCEYVVKESCA